MLQIGDEDTNKRPRRRSVQSKLSFAQAGGGEDLREEVVVELEKIGEGNKIAGKGKRQTKLSFSRINGSGREVVVEVEDDEEVEIEIDDKRKGRRRGHNYRARATEKSPDIYKESPESKKKASPLKDEQNYQKLDNDCGDATPDATPSNGEYFNSPKQKKRQKKGTSIRKIDLDSGSRDLHLPVADLWSEAKKAAEENMRLSAGKQTHPFFACWKATKKESKITDVAKWERKHTFDDNSLSYIHVFDAEGDDVLLDWKHWLFAKRIMSNEYPLNNIESVYEGSLQPLRVDALSYTNKKARIDTLADEKEICPSATSCICTSILPNGPTVNKQFSEIEVLGHSKPCSLSRSNSSYESEQHEKLLKERIAIYYQRSSSQAPGSLWTDRYQPENAMEICGNQESVNFLRDWLKSWQTQVPKARNSQCSNSHDTEDGEDSLYENDYETEDDQESLKNALLITGPVGSGKSAAIYACAKEQGFEVIEINASDLRSGSYVKEKFGEATESHGFGKWSAEDTICLKRNHLAEYVSSQSDSVESEEHDDEPTKAEERILEQYMPQVECPREENTNFQVATKSLILFEDVDIVFSEDRGFISTILQLAHTSKRPIILTSNNDEPTLPHLLKRLVLSFQLPSSTELFNHVYNICAAEKAQVSSNLLQHLVNSCQGDVRKTLMLLQFWCQGSGSITEGNVHSTCSPLLLDVNAAHTVIPRVIPWTFSCKLAEKIEEEVTKAISVMEEDLKYNGQDIIPMKNLDSSNMATPIKKRKYHRLQKNFMSPKECSNDLNDLDDYSDALDSLMMVNPRARRAIFCSQSDDECRTDNLQAQRKDPVGSTDLLLPDVCTLTNVQTSDSANDKQKLIPSEIQLTEEATLNKLGCLEPSVSVSRICDTFKLQDLSHVSESSLFCSGDGGKEEPPDLSSFITSANIVSGGGNTMSVGSFTEVNGFLDINVGYAGAFDIESFHVGNELRQSQHEDELPVSIGYQMMDECSRADFGMHLVTGKIAERTSKSDLVHETWRKLRKSHIDMKEYLATDCPEASLVLNITSGLTHLICEADVLFYGCNPYFSDLLEPSMTPSVEPDDFCCHDRQCHISSTYAEHGLCMYIKKCGEIGSTFGFQTTLDFSKEMLPCQTSTVALGKLLVNQVSHIQGNLLQYRQNLSSKRQADSGVYKAVASVLPLRSNLVLKGSAYHEYLSFMSLISKFERCRLSKTSLNNRRRRSRHYLSHVSRDHVENLAQSFCFSNVVLLDQNVADTGNAGRQHDHCDHLTKIESKN